MLRLLSKLRASIHRCDRQVSHQVLVINRFSKTNQPPRFVPATKFLPSSLLKTSNFQQLAVQLRHFSSADDQSTMGDNRFVADYDKLGRASCKKCKQKLNKGELRIAKVVANFFHDGDGVMKQYHHPKCIFDTFIRARATTKIIEGADDIEGFAELKTEDKDSLKALIVETMDKKGSPKKVAANRKSPAAKKNTPAKASPLKAVKAEPAAGPSRPRSDTPSPPVVKDDEPIPDSRDFSTAEEKDNAFRQFRRLCAEIAEVGSYLEKTKIIKQCINKGSSGSGYKGDLYLLLKLLLPGEKGNKTVYNLSNKQLVKIFSLIFAMDQDDMVEDLEQGDVAETVRIYFEKSKVCPPHKKSILSIPDVDRYLSELSLYTKEDDQQRVLTKITKRCTANDLKMVVRLIKHDLRINSGAKHVLEALDPNAYEAFQASRNLRDVVDRVIALKKSNASVGSLTKKLSIKACLMTPVLPMLAEACKSVEFAFKRCPNGMYAEIKYDGERVQLHKQASDFSYFSRSLKPVLPHKVQHFKKWIPEAFPGGSDMILDAEVLLIDTKTSKPLPFGTLGVHKKAQFSDANVCLYIFDILHYNGETLMEKPMKERRKILSKVMTEVPNRILFSEMEHITEPQELRDMMMKTFREGLEGLVLKDLQGVYEPGKRHWLKVKKDYLAEGAMADSADLVMLGAYYGTGNKGGMMSVFLMGCYDTGRDRWLTVTKCHCGFDDATIDRLQKKLEPNMEKISQDKHRIPNWIKINKTLVPDFVVKDPKKSPVWEITGAEFTKSESHTADGISIRFPRMTKMRDDKDWTNHTDLARLKVLYKKSKETSDMPDLLGASTTSKASAPSSERKRKGSDEEASPSKKSRTEFSPSKKTPSKSPCKYGSKCYQSSSEHRTKFSHEAGANGRAPTTTHLPDIFSGMCFYMPENVEKAKLLTRYIVAFDGDVEKLDKSSATHIIVTSKKELDDNHVHIDWVWNCIKKKKLLPSS